MASSKAQADLLSPVLGPGKHQVGDVEAGEQQKQGDRGQQEVVGMAADRAQEKLVDRLEFGTPAGVRVRELLGESSSKRADLLIRRSEIDLGLQAGKGGEPTIPRGRRRIEAVEQEQVVVLVPKPKPLGQYADDRPELSIQVDTPTDDLRIAGKISPPAAVSQHDLPKRRPTTLFGDRKGTALTSFDPEHTNQAPPAGGSFLQGEYTAGVHRS